MNHATQRNTDRYCAAIDYRRLTLGAVLLDFGARANYSANASPASLCDSSIRLSTISIEWSVYSWSREVTRSEMEYIQVHVNGAIKRGKVLGPLTLQLRITHVSAVTLLMASDLNIGREARHIGHELSTRTNNVHDLLRFSFLSSSPID